MPRIRTAKIILKKKNKARELILVPRRYFLDFSVFLYSPNLLNHRNRCAIKRGNVYSWTLETFVLHMLCVLNLTHMSPHGRAICSHSKEHPILSESGCLYSGAGTPPFFPQILNLRGPFLWYDLTVSAGHIGLSSHHLWDSDTMDTIKLWVKNGVISDSESWCFCHYQCIYLSRLYLSI